MPIDVTRLDKVKRLPNGKVTARCPACAQQGGDKKGVHLIIYSDGKFGCVAYQGDQKHRKEIYRLCGAGFDRQRQPTSLNVRYVGW